MTKDDIITLVVQDFRHALYDPLRPADRDRIRGLLEGPGVSLINEQISLTWKSMEALGYVKIDVISEGYNSGYDGLLYFGDNIR